ncbi:sigma 54-interacting transcriptional regulator, partial [Pseudoflavonifractor phocaeensis]|uniref:sigma 54-interacting transcriptional regulator n=1 Tax=Pseudoflavonifractor phocaeensis TaxID=1870988 RepID=UPI00195CD25C
MAQDSLSALLDGQGIVAADPVMYALYQKAAYLAKMDATILLCGESGVGKDRLAKFVHQAGPRRDAPFIHVNCSAVPQALFEAELFGYESGTFTGGLTQGKQGLLEAAHGGTLFLDEIGEMSLANQVKLLDFLQTRQVARLGGGRRRDLDVRVISATNRDLKACVAQGIFREDLYYRICVVVLDIPPLRARPADIAAFAKGFLARSCPGRALTEDAVAFLQAQDWPGNLRELNNFLERACILSEEEAISASLLAPFYQNAPRPA